MRRSANSDVDERVTERMRVRWMAFVLVVAAATAAAKFGARSRLGSRVKRRAESRVQAGARGLSAMVRRVEVDGMEVLEVDPVAGRAAAAATLVFLHGLGDTAHGWADMFARLALRRTRVVLPTARAMPISVNGGMRMPAWMDLYDFPVSDVANVREDAAGLAQSVGVLRRLARREIDALGFTPDRVFAGGFSQGGAVALAYALQRDAASAPAALAGVVALSTWLPLHKVYLDAGANATVPLARDTPIFWGHGDADTIVPHALGRRSADIIEKELGFSRLSFNSFPGVGHGADPAGLQLLREFVEGA